MAQPDGKPLRAYSQRSRNPKAIRYHAKTEKL
jgi:hypothetical protein